MTPLTEKAQIIKLVCDALAAVDVRKASEIARSGYPLSSASRSSANVVGVKPRIYERDPRTIDAKHHGNLLARGVASEILGVCVLGPSGGSYLQEKNPPLLGQRVQLEEEVFVSRRSFVPVPFSLATRPTSEKDSGSPRRFE